MSANTFAKYGSIAVSIALYVLAALGFSGLLPSSEVLRYPLAVILMFASLARLLGYFSRDFYCLAFQYDLGLGTLLGVIGAFTLVRQFRMQDIFRAMTLFVFADSLFRIQMALDSSRFGLESWKMLLVCGIVTAVTSAGYLASSYVGRPNSGMVSWMILSAGILNHLVMVTAVKPWKKTEHGQTRAIGRWKG